MGRKSKDSRSSDTAPFFCAPFTAVIAFYNIAALIVMVQASRVYTHKFVRVGGECWKNFVDPEMPNSSYCCHSDADWPCFWGMGMTKWLSTFAGAWFVPLTTSILHSVLLLLTTNSQHFTLRSVRRRVCLYLFLFVFRTFVLYQLPGAFEVPDDGCWYQSQRKCTSKFDFSDHVVLNMIHHVMVPMLDTCAILFESSTFAHKLICSLWALSISSTALWGMFHTVAAFHTPAESWYAYVLTFAVQIPVVSMLLCTFQRIHFGAFFFAYADGEMVSDRSVSYDKNEKRMSRISD